MVKLDDVFNVADKKELKELNNIVDKIDDLEANISQLSDKELKLKTNEFKKRLESGETLEDILVEAFAVIREASKRVLGMRQYRVQLIGGLVLHRGNIAEMKTGEGKTLVGVAPVYLNALTGNGVHVVTVNDYLAKRDKEIMEPIYNFMGLTVGVILHGQDPLERKLQYQCDITYGTNNEYGFDYLKDNMVMDKQETVQRELNFAIVDEIDSILIDEARTPLIISGQVDQDELPFRLANIFIKMLLPEDYIYDEKDKTISLTELGIKKAEQFYKMDNLMDLENMETYHHVNQALRADILMTRDVDYVVREGKVEIVDEFTGRVMEGRRFSEGLHQAIEAKEDVEIQAESKTLASITYQNYFRMYNKLSGMTGTAKTEEQEFESTYKMSVIQIPTNKPIQRIDLEDVIYKGEVAKFKAIVKQIEKIHQTGQPILAGTASVEKSEILSYLLDLRGLPHEVLNAKNDEKEAQIIAKAGKLNAITIATNMAGRGTDISLGAGDKDEEEKIKSLGGLYVIGTEKHENRRIDNQLKGRAGRQGDPGVSQFYVSLEDELMRLYAGSKVQKIGEKLEDNTVIDNKYIKKSVETAQKNLESKNFGIRKEVLKYDDVINKQRNLIYKDRKKVLLGEDIRSVIKGIEKSVIKEAFEKYVKVKETEEGIEYITDDYKKYIKEVFRLNELEIDNVDIDTLKDITYDIVQSKYQEIEDRKGNSYMRDYERLVLLKVVDSYWVDHIDTLDQLQKTITLQAIGQKDPVKEYTVEAFDMFENINRNINVEILMYLYEQ
ncbi:preprotein translocase subunit SecA [Romboutsia lituseburensis]|uniref:preprotein translocase subunit SecA n=1 Tax=Romboutsia lituseburensis TaxID=1537 RepID=UPI00215AB92B|nr:preprotein translocase subunit SecA [Romboutsia lituseburensis]MCR8745435.1 preprotein translocase subunit SecA [Romboutsia lituseburensis]